MDEVQRVTKQIVDDLGYGRASEMLDINSGILYRVVRKGGHSPKLRRHLVEKGYIKPDRYRFCIELPEENDYNAQIWNAACRKNGLSRYELFELVCGYLQEFGLP